MLIKHDFHRTSMFKYNCNTQQISKPLSIYVDLFDDDLDKFVVDKIKENFDLVQNKMLKLNKPIYEKHQHMDILEEFQMIVDFSWEKLLKRSSK